MSDRVFLDTNILIYIYSKTEASKSEICINAVNDNECYTSTQALNELCNICTKKWKIDKGVIDDAVDEICSVLQINLINETIIKKALCLHYKYQYSYYDCLMLASALESGCNKIFSEDMQAGQVIENTLEIVNIFSIARN